MSENRDYGDEGIPNRDDFWGKEQAEGRPGPPGPEPILPIDYQAQPSRVSRKEEMMTTMDMAVLALKELEDDVLPRSAVGDQSVYHQKIAWASVLAKCAMAYYFLVREGGR